MDKFVKPFFIGIDAGTQGIRTGIVDSQGNFVTSHEEFYKTLYPHIGWAQQKPEDWWQAFNSTLKRCMDDINDEIKMQITACCVCATSSTVIPVDKQGNPLTDAILWMDSRAKKEAKMINTQNHEVLNYCGGEVSVEWLVPKALWIKNNQDDIYSSSYKIIEQLDWLNFKLTGQWTSSICNSTCKSNYIDDYGKWNDEFFKSIGFDDYEEKLLTNVKKIGERVGTFSALLALKFGLPHDISVVQGGIDAHIAMLGMGVVAPGKIACIMGTSFVHLAFSEKPIFQKGIWGPYNKAVLPNYWLLEGGQISAGSITKWFIDTFNVKEDDAYVKMMNEAAKIKPGSEGLVTLDYFSGNRTPYKDPDASGVIYGLNLKHTRAHIYRSMLEGVALGTKNVVENFQKQGYEIKSLIGCGGVTKNKLWLQIIADATGIEIVVNVNTKAGILGCCMAAAVGSGRYKNFEKAGYEMVHEDYRIVPNKESSLIYNEMFKKYKDIYRSLSHIMHDK